MIPKKVRLLLVILTLIGAILACESSEQVSTVDDDAPTITTTIEIIEPTSDIPIDTPTPQFTSTPQYTPTPASQGHATIIVNSCNLRSGPGTNYSIVGAGEKGDVMPIFGKNEDGTWLWIDWTKPIWIASSLVELDVDISEISYIDYESLVFAEEEVIVTIEITETLLPTFTPTPDSAGVSGWMNHRDRYVGAKDIAFDTHLGYYRPEQGKIFVSIYIIAKNNSTSTVTFTRGSFGLIDGQGRLLGRAISATKGPSFSTCTVRPGGVCEGWWTSIVINQPASRNELRLYWDPCFLCSRLEVPIEQ